LMLGIELSKVLHTCTLPVNSIPNSLFVNESYSMCFCLLLLISSYPTESYLFYQSLKKLIN
jgi:hypothetical protein